MITSLALENGDELKTLGYITLDLVFDLATKALDLFTLCVDDIPYGLRWIFKQMRSLLRVI